MPHSCLTAFCTCTTASHASIWLGHAYMLVVVQSSQFAPLLLSFWPSNAPLKHCLKAELSCGSAPHGRSAASQAPALPAVWHTLMTVLAALGQLALRRLLLLWHPHSDLACLSGLLGRASLWDDVQVSLMALQLIG